MTASDLLEQELVSLNGAAPLCSVNDLPYCRQQREEGSVRGVGLHRFPLKVKGEAVLSSPSRCSSWNAQSLTLKTQIIFWLTIQKDCIFVTGTVFVVQRWLMELLGLSKCLFNRVNLAQYLTHTCADKTFKVRRQGLTPCLPHMGFYPRAFNDGIWGLYIKTGFYCLSLNVMLVQ